MINWKVRVRNKNFWLALIPAVLLLVQVVAAVFGFTIDLGDMGDKLLAVVNAVFAVLAILGIVTDFGNFCIIPVALLIYRMNGRAGNNIVELVEKYALPALVKLLLRILGSRQLGSHCADRLGILIKELALSVVPLVLRL